MPMYHSVYRQLKRLYLEEPVSFDFYNSSLNGGQADPEKNLRD